MDDEVSIHEHKKTVAAEMTFGVAGESVIFARNSDGVVELHVLDSSGKEIVKRRIPDTKFNDFRNTLQKV